MKQSKLLLVLTITFMVASEYLLADIIPVQITGNVTSIYEERGFTLDGSVEVGSLMTGTFFYDTESPNIAPPNLSNGIYEIISVTMDIGNYGFYNDLSGEPPLFTTYVTDPGYDLTASDSYFDGVFYDYGIAKTYGDIEEFSVTKLNANLMAYNSEDVTYGQLPTSFPDISAFWRKEFKVTFTELGEAGTNGYFAILGELTSIQVIPEPGTLLFLSAGAAIFLRKRK